MAGDADPVVCGPAAGRRQRAPFPSWRWSDDPLRQEWNRACVTAKVPHIPLYQGTKHTTATALAEGGIGVYALKALGGWKDSRSAELIAAVPNSQKGSTSSWGGPRKTLRRVHADD